MWLCMCEYEVERQGLAEENLKTKQGNEFLSMFSVQVLNEKSSNNITKDCSSQWFSRTKLVYVKSLVKC